MKHVVKLVTSLTESRYVNVNFSYTLEFQQNDDTNILARR